MTPQELANLTPAEIKAVIEMHRAGYRIIDEKIYRMTSDSDAERIWEGDFVADSDGVEQDWENLKAHGLPSNSNIMCACGEGESALGGRCAFCDREYWAQDRAETELAIRRGK